MPLTEEERNRLLQRAGQSLPQAPSGLPPEIAAIVQSLPQGQPTVTGFTGKSPRITVPPTQQAVQRDLLIKQAEEKLKAGIPGKPAESERRDFARFRTFEGLFSIMEDLASRVPKGPVKGRYTETAARVSGGGKVDLPGEGLDVGRETSSDAVNYADLRAPVAAGFYRAVTGDDRISDIDAAKRAMPFVPSLALSEEAFNERLQIVKTAVQLRKAAQQEALRTGGKPSLSDEKAFYDLVNQARKVVKSQKSKKVGGQRMRDAQGREAIVYPDGSFEPVQ